MTPKKKKKNFLFRPRESKETVDIREEMKLDTFKEEWRWLIGKENIWQSAPCLQKMLYFYVNQWSIHRHLKLNDDDVWWWKSYFKFLPVVNLLQVIIYLPFLFLVLLFQFSKTKIFIWHFSTRETWLIQ